MLRVTMRMSLAMKMMLRRMKLKPRTLTPLVCCPIAKVYAAAGEVVAEGSVTGVEEAHPEARSKVKFAQAEEQNVGARQSFVSISKD